MILFGGKELPKAISSEAELFIDVKSIPSTIDSVLDHPVEVKLEL
tara:strand:+ start:1046 stop:1180 length:135 start_codon:yes stop_codon:yes gene_type:complete